MKILVTRIDRRGHEIITDDNPINSSFRVTEIEVEATIQFLGEAKFEGTFTFLPKGFECTFDHAEKRIRELFKDK